MATDPFEHDRQNDDMLAELNPEDLSLRRKTWRHKK
jgi:hypothetical protein